MFRLFSNGEHLLKLTSDGEIEVKLLAQVYNDANALKEITQKQRRPMCLCSCSLRTKIFKREKPIKTQAKGVKKVGILDPKPSKEQHNLFSFL